MRIAEGTKVMLSGDADAPSGFNVDDLILFEVLEPVSGTLIDAGVIGSHVNVTRDGTPVKRLVPAAAHAGPGLGFPFAANAVDLAPLLPKDRVFRLRVSSLDVVGDALATNVFLQAHHGDPPLVTDPFNPESCSGPKMTRDEALSFIAPGNDKAWNVGVYSIATRARDCGLTGCTGWRDPVATEALVSNYKGHASRGKVPLGSGAIHLWTENGQVYTWLADEHAEFWCQWHSDPDVQCMYVTPGRLPIDIQFGDKVALRPYARTETIHATRGCLRFSVKKRLDVPGNSDRYTDVEAVWLGKFTR